VLEDGLQQPLLLRNSEKWHAHADAHGHGLLALYLRVDLIAFDVYRTDFARNGK
jgi:hypothetical protein